LRDAGSIGRWKRTDMVCVSPAHSGSSSLSSEIGIFFLQRAQKRAALHQMHLLRLRLQIRIYASGIMGWKGFLYSRPFPCLNERGN